MDKEKLENLINKFFLKQLTLDEKVEFEDILKSSDEARKLFRQWSFIQRGVETIQFNKTCTLPELEINLKDQKEKPNRVSLWKQRIINIAAVLTIPLLIGFLYLFVEKNNSLEQMSHELSYTNINSKAILITLPDSSKVYLYAKSTLKFPSVFTENERHVKLMGEATFEVVSDPENPFYVETLDGVKVKAYGTKFNVYGYEDDDIVQVYLERGKVNFSSPYLSEPTAMRASTKLEFNRKSKSIQVLPSDAFEYEAYEKGILLFRSTSLERITKKLSRVYDVDIEIRDNQLRHYPITGVFENKSITQILDVLQMSSPDLKWKKEKEKIVLYRKP